MGFFFLALFVTFFTICKFFVIFVPSRRGKGPWDFCTFCYLFLHLKKGGGGGVGLFIYCLFIFSFYSFYFFFLYY